MRAALGLALIGMWLLWWLPTIALDAGRLVVRRLRSTR